ncbi:SDR family oxidoreductase [Pedobacter psychrodurus]|uniref:SDR family oxidoreductase n=1 Tax=Pedobacter psychrodurus TaxID=2530456 RepID=UPI002931069B|nr:SDR family oxidoreductase [Pedobacter psychrodurus]
MGQINKIENKKRNIVVTGASSGAGRAIALAFASNGDNLTIGSRNLSALKELAEECSLHGVSVKCVETDVADYHSVINLAATASETYGSIDVWVNNAGVLAIGEFDITPMEVSEQVIRTNLLGYMHGAHAALPYFKAQGNGILINNISIGGFLPVPFGASYSAAKFGLRGFSSALKSELVKYPKIFVCDVFPGFLDTPGMQHAANYTGKVLKPGPIVYDPNRLAQEIIKLSLNPKKEKMVGSFSSLLRISRVIFPELTDRISGSIITTYLKQAKSIEPTSGNLFNPVDFGNSVYGGWGIPGRPKAHRKYIAIGALVFISALLIRKKL